MGGVQSESPAIWVEVQNLSGDIAEELLLQETGLEVLGATVSFDGEVVER